MAAPVPSKGRGRPTKSVLGSVRHLLTAATSIRPSPRIPMLLSTNQIAPRRAAPSRICWR